VRFAGVEKAEMGHLVIDVSDNQIGGFACSLRLRTRGARPYSAQARGECVYARALIADAQVARDFFAGFEAEPAGLAANEEGVHVARIEGEFACQFRR